MIVYCVSVHVKKENIEDFIKATEENHLGSLKEPGVLRFDVIQNIEDPTKFILYEAYADEEASKAHKNTEHYRTWKEIVADYMQEPRRGKGYRVIFPSERNLWKTKNN